MRAGAVVTRRQALLMGAAGAWSLVRRSSWAAACAATPKKTEGPFFVDERLERSDIRVDPADGSVAGGMPLRLEITVLRGDAGCRPAAGVQVDLWHASALGRYSDEAANGTVGRKFLRGYQRTNGGGRVEFTTVYPGWYPGRTTHIHFKVRTFDAGRTASEFTSQLFFDDAVTDRAMALPPYAGRRARDTTNATDDIFHPGLLLTLTEDNTRGWLATFTATVDNLPAKAASGRGLPDSPARRA